MVCSRGIKTFQWPSELTVERVRQWFIEEGLVPPSNIIFDNIEKQAGAEEKSFDTTKLIRTAIEGMVYHLYYPYSEANIGPPDTTG